VSIYKRGSTWVVQIGSRKHRRRVVVGPNKAEAKAVEAHMLAEIRAGRFPELRTVKPILFRNHAAEVLTKHYSAKRSHHWAKLIIENRLDPSFGSLYLGAITPETISSHMARRRAEGVSGGTVRNELAVLSLIMSLAVKWERVASNPVSKADKPKPTKGRLRWLTRDEADALLSNAAKHIKAVIITALQTGGRLSEVMGLRWDDIDFDRGLLFFRQTNTKNARQREIPMTPLLIATLRSLPRSINTSAVFHRHGKPLVDIKEAFMGARDRADLGKDVTFHTLRHSFASWFMMAGGDIYRLQKYLGHSTVTMTERYAHLSPTYLRDGVGMMGQAPASTAADGSGSRVPTDVPTSAARGGSGSRN